MKILLTFEDRVRADSTGVYFKKAFSKLGDVMHCYNEDLQHINPKNYDIFIKIDDGLETHRFPKEFHPSVYYVIDTHIHPDWRLKLAKEAEFDYIFCAQKPGSELAWDSKNVMWLPLACDPDTHFAYNRNSKLYDICFIGNTQPAWQGRRVERLDKLFASIPNFYYGNKFFKDVTEIYADSKLVFNSAYSNDINMRVFEAMCSGTALLTDAQDWQGLFEPNKHLIEYSSDEEMIDRALFHVKHEDRIEIAKTAQREVMSKHTYLDRCKTILEKVN
ncbi:hypothetical protein LCGC14_1429680 [marine sediment metagenome]|uniref:Spore protein YkvP/CgeB glycosyl transferase-like domain-containing protein n=1 Tax=marine sediment metagenome TaxID=412755 RepID=A0A0F9KA69_9ZZZZ